MKQTYLVEVSQAHNFHNWVAIRLEFVTFIYLKLVFNNHVVKSCACFSSDDNKIFSCSTDTSLLVQMLMSLPIPRIFPWWVLQKSFYDPFLDQRNEFFNTPSFQGPTKLKDLKQESHLHMDITSPEMAAISWPFYVFLGGSMFCLLSSSICHLFSCHSHHLNILLIQMDYVGITVMIITSFFPPIYYIFQCTPHWQIVYLTGITIMGIFTIITLLSPAFSTGKYRSFRVCLFMSMGFFGIVPAIHAVVVNWNDPYRNITLAYELVMALSYLIGASFYVSRIPERWKPGWFDLAGHSHQIFHVFVIMGALAHYGAAQIFLRLRSRMGCD